MLAESANGLIPKPGSASQSGLATGRSMMEYPIKETVVKARSIDSSKVGRKTAILAATVFVAAAISVNAAWAGSPLCFCDDPPPRGDPVLCGQFTAALHESAAMDQAGTSKAEKDARTTQLGLTLPNGEFKGWLMLAALSRQNQCVLELQANQQELQAKQNRLQAEVDMQAARRAQAFAQIRAEARNRSEGARDRSAYINEQWQNRLEMRKQTRAIEDLGQPSIQRHAPPYRDYDAQLRRIERNSQYGVPYRNQW